MQTDQNIKIRLAHLSEKELLEALQWRASLNNPGDREALLAHPDAIELPESQIKQGLVITALLKGSIVGFAGILKRGDGNAQLDALFVEPAHWKKGIGHKLVESCVSMAIDQGAKILHVIGNPHAEGFYFSCGFATSGTEMTRFGIGLLMERALN
jgi:GNAT superfamily N-acetyltransferase